MASTLRRDPPVERVADVLRAVLPANVAVNVTDVLSDGRVTLHLHGIGDVIARWIGSALPQDIDEAAAGPHADLLVAARGSATSRTRAIEAGFGWVDETGGAEVALPGLLLARDPRPVSESRSGHWRPSTVGTVEALLNGTRATVSAVQEATGSSAGAATSSLKHLERDGLLAANEDRGPQSGRYVRDVRDLFDAYLTQVRLQKPPPSLVLGVVPSEIPHVLEDAARDLDQAGTTWALTGVAAANVIAPLLTSVPLLDIYVDAGTVAALSAIAQRLDLRPTEGGRMTLRTFPTDATRRLSEPTNGSRSAPWARVCADLLASNVPRAEEAVAELLEHNRDRARTKPAS